MGNICDNLGVNSWKERNVYRNRTSPSSKADNSIIVAENENAALDGDSDAPTAVDYQKKLLADALSPSSTCGQCTQGPRITLLPHQHTLFCERKV